MPRSIKVVIPLTRADGHFSFNAAITHGGRMGGRLRPLLALDGNNQDAQVAQAAAALTQNQRLYELPVRRKEFDIEHLGAALEADADLFVTVDRATIINRYRAVREQFRDDPVITRAIDFSVTPGEALEKIRNP